MADFVILEHLQRVIEMCVEAVGDFGRPPDLCSLIFCLSDALLTHIPHGQKGSVRLPLQRQNKREMGLKPVEGKHSEEHQK